MHLFLSRITREQPNLQIDWGSCSSSIVASIYGSSHLAIPCSFISSEERTIWTNESPSSLLYFCLSWCISRQGNSLLRAQTEAAWVLEQSRSAILVFGKSLSVVQFCTSHTCLSSVPDSYLFEVMGSGSLFILQFCQLKLHMALPCYIILLAIFVI